MSVNPQSPDGDSRTGTYGRVLAAFTATAVAGGVLAAAIAMPAVGVVGAVSNSAVASFEALPDDLNEPVLKQRVAMRDAAGGLLAVYWSENRIVVPLDQISEDIQDAIIAIEDERFYEHNGVDVRGTLRALATNSGAGEIQQGGSTITQQYVKMILLNNAQTEEEAQAAVERTPQRKLREASYAISLEKTKTKEEILEGYLNVAYFGAGAYGIEVAAERYFGVRANEVTLEQAAMLAGVVQQPGAFNPLQNPRAAESRRNAVLARMYEQEFITEEEYENAVALPIEETLNPWLTLNGCPTSSAPYFCDYVMQSILNDPAFGETREQRQAFLDRGGFFIQTSLDPTTQAAANQAVIDAIPADDPSGKATAISMVQPGTGRVLAMSQNRTWGTEGPGVTTYNYNVDIAHGGTQGMQAGSTFKVFTLLTALEAGFNPYQTLPGPQTRTFTGFRNCEGFRFPPYTVENSTGAGTFNMYSGTAKSVNTYFVALAERLPMCRLAEITQAMGVYKGNGEPLEQVPSFTLGANEVTPLAMAGAYAAVANHGRFCAPHGIDRIDTYVARDAVETIYVPPTDCPQVVSERVADTTARILVNVVDNGTGRAVKFDHPAAGKTGTTDSNAAVWFAGFTPQAATAVWVGDPRGGFRYPLRNLVINGEYVQAGFGSTLAGPTWKTVMEAYHADKPVEGFNFSAASDSYSRPQPERTSGEGGTVNRNTDGDRSESTPAPAPATGESDTGATGATDFGADFFDQLNDGNPPDSEVLP